MLLTELKEFKTKLEYHRQLNPAIWEDGDILRKDIQEKLQEIADTFIDFAEVPKSKVKDIHFTGSNTNYNWTELSDIDLHIIADLSELDQNGLDAKRLLWNETHNISLHGFPVELYIEDITQPAVSAGVYSVKQKKWLKEPEFKNIKFDYDKIKVKAAKWMVKIDKLIDSNTKDINALNKIKDHIRNSRRKDLAKGGEFTMENLVFKSLRNNGYLDKLYNYIIKIQDESLSIK